jgi:MFS family permease
MSIQRQKDWILAVLLSALFITNIDVAVVNVATPSIHERLRASPSELQLAVSGYVLSYAMLLITGARLGDIHGYRRIFLIGAGIFTAASVACGLAPMPEVLIVSRLVQGVGAALMVPQVLLGIQLTFTGPERGRALGLYAVTLSGGAVAGQVLGGVLISLDLFGTGWRPIFLINLPLGIALLIAAYRVLPFDRGGRPHRLDVSGVVTLSAAVLMLILPLVFGRTLHWPRWLWICLISSLLPLAAFVRIERRIADRGGYPLINLNFLGRPAIAWCLLAYSAATLTYFALLFTLALYLQQGLGRTPLYSGLALVSWVTAFGLAGPLVPRISPRLAPLAAPFGYLMLTLAYAAISLSLFAGHIGGVLLIALLGVGGLGHGIGFTANIRHLTASAPSRYAPDISGVITTIAQTAGLTGVATFGSLYFALVAPPRPLGASHAFAVITAGFAVTALFATIGVYRATHSAVPGDAQVVASRNSSEWLGG